MKISVSKQKIACPRSQRLRGHAIFELAIEYLRENEKVRETACACSYGALVESYKKRKKWSQISFFRIDYRMHS